MGQTLSEPVTTKQSSYCQNDSYRVGSSCMQGWRINMEDSHTHILSLPDDPGTSFFAVYDGHGGANVAQYAGKHLHKFVLKRPEYNDNNIEKALKQAFLDIDYEMLHNESWGEQMAGSTAVCVLIKNNRLYCANAGDSRAIACINGKLEALSLDHKPNNEMEAKRINEGGGWVEFNRVNGNLALSRALGDFVFKKNANKTPEQQIVTAYPDVETREITPDWEFIVLACDGIWDVMTNSEVMLFVRERIGLGMYPEEICEQLMNHCLAPDCQMGGLGGDNMTVVVVCLLNNKPYEDLIARCSSSVNSTTAANVSASSATDINNKINTNGENDIINTKHSTISDDFDDAFDAGDGLDIEGKSKISLDVQKSEILPKEESKTTTPLSSPNATPTEATPSEKNPFIKTSTTSLLSSMPVAPLPAAATTTPTVTPSTPQSPSSVVGKDLDIIY